MKNYRVALFISLGMTMLWISACKKAEIETITSESPTGKKTITITGEQSMAGDPITVHIDFKVPGGTEQATFEFQAMSMTEKNVIVTWEDDSHGNIIFNMDDGERWWVDFVCEDSLVSAVKRWEP